MQLLEENTQKIEELFLQQKSFLLKAKVTMALMGLGGILLVHVKLLSYQEIHPKMDDWQIYLSDFVVASLVFSSIAFIPLYQFFEDRIMQRMNWSIKSSIIKTTLQPYTNKYHLSFKGLLPDDDIKDLELQKGFLQFCYGDDLIFGTMGNKTFRISEIHSVSLFKRNFDGLVGVLLFPKHIDDEQSRKMVSIINDMNVDNSFSYLIKRNKLFLILKGNKKHFEFQIKKNKINKEALTNDFTQFQVLIKTLSELSNIA